MISVAVCGAQWVQESRLDFSVEVGRRVPVSLTRLIHVLAVRERLRWRRCRRCGAWRGSGTASAVIRFIDTRRERCARPLAAAAHDRGPSWVHRVHVPPEGIMSLSVFLGSKSSKRAPGRLLHIY